jgi:iron complex transport system permease protein
MTHAAGPVALAALVLAALCVGSLATGAAQVDLAAALHDPDAAFVLLASRGPRTLAALFTGAGLAAAGLVMQMLAQNPFVEPATAGGGQSAALGLLGASILAPDMAVELKMLAAAAAAMVGTAVFLAMVARLPPRQPLLAPLTGLVYGAVLGAMGTYVAWQYDLLQYLGIWLSGDFSGVLRGRYELLWLSAGLTIAAYLAADRFAIAGLGKDAATGLGLRHRRVAALGLAIVAGIMALAAATVGTLPFVGLVAPNLVRRVMGDDLRRALPWTAFAGAALVLACDLAGRVVIAPYEAPAGLMFGIVGAAVFLWLIFAAPARG